MRVESAYENLIFSTTRIVASLPDGSQSIGTAFIYTATLEDGLLFPNVVTNRHVIQGSVRFSIDLNTGKDQEVYLGRAANTTFVVRGDQWNLPQDSTIDLAAYPIAPMISQIQSDGHEVFFRTLDEDMILKSEQLPEIDAVEDVIIIGYPSGIYDPVNLLPIVRKGITATPLTIDFAGRPEFLVDASVFPGSSGSPVFLYKTGFYSPKGKGVKLGLSLYFLGVVSSVFTRNDDASIETVDVPTGTATVFRSTQMIDIGTVVKARCVKELIDSVLNSRGLRKAT